MSEFAKRRIYGYDAAGRRRLVAGVGQPIPAGVVEVERPVVAETHEDLTRLSRAELNEVARNRGVPNPERLANKRAVIEAIGG